MCKYLLRDNGNKVGATPWQKIPCMYYKHIALQYKFMAGKVLLLQGLPGVEICRERPDVQTACPVMGHRLVLSLSLPLISIPRSHFGQCHMHRHTGIPHHSQDSGARGGVLHAFRPWG